MALMSTFIRFVDAIKLEVVVSTLEDRIRIQSDLDKLEKGTEIDKIKLNKGKRKVPGLGRKNQMYK